MSPAICASHRHPHRTSTALYLGLLCPGRQLLPCGGHGGFSTGTRDPSASQLPACVSPAQESRLGSRFPDPCKRVEEGGFDLPLVSPGAQFFQKWAQGSELGDPGIGRARPE